jgi:hypothetical protein
MTMPHETEHHADGCHRPPETAAADAVAEQARQAIHDHGLTEPSATLLEAYVGQVALEGTPPPGPTFDALVNIEARLKIVLDALPSIIRAGPQTAEVIADVERVIVDLVTDVVRLAGADIADRELRLEQIRVFAGEVAARTTELRIRAEDAGALRETLLGRTVEERLDVLERHATTDAGNRLLRLEETVDALKLALDADIRTKNDALAHLRGTFGPVIEANRTRIEDVVPRLEAAVLAIEANRQALTGKLERLEDRVNDLDTLVTEHLPK